MKLFILLQTINGLTERFNQTVSWYPAKITDDWDDKLDTILMGHRASQQASSYQAITVFHDVLAANEAAN